MQGNHSLHRFGWQSPTHRGIDQGAIAQIDSPLLQTYLRQNLPSIQGYDDAQDLYCKGPRHYINLEAGNNQETGVPLTASSWTQALKAFHPDQKNRWQNGVLEEQALPKGPSVYQAVLMAFQKVQIAFSQVSLATLGEQPAFLQRNLFMAIGEMGHYISDLFMPMHTTQFMDWYLHPNSPKSMHHFIEGESTPSLSGQSIALEKPAVSLQTLKPFLLDSIRSSYLKMFDIVETHQQLLATELDKPSFENSLRQRLQPILLEQVTRAQQAFSALLNLAWQSRFQPSFTQGVQSPLVWTSSRQNCVTPPFTL